MLYNQTPTQEELNEEKAKKEQIDKAKQKQIPEQNTASIVQDTTQNDSLRTSQLRSTLGAFAYGASLPSAKTGVTEIKNELVTLRVANKGGYIAEANLNFEQFKKGSNQRVELIKQNNADFNLQFKTKDNRILNTRDMYFEPVLTKEGNNDVLTMRLKAGPEQYLEYRYVMKPNEYMLDFSIRTQGLSQVLDTSKPIDLEWQIKGFRNEKSVTYENRYTELVYEYEDGKDDYLGQGEN